MVRFIPLAKKKYCDRVGPEMSGHVNLYGPAAYLRAEAIATTQACPQALPALRSHSSN